MQSIEKSSAKPRNWKWLLLLFILALAVPVIRAWYESTAWLKEARVAVREGRTEEAIENYRRAVSWIAPYNSTPHTASRELLALIDTIQDPALKMHATWELRSALLSTRSLGDAAPALFGVEWREEVLRTVERKLSSYRTAPPLPNTPQPHTNPLAFLIVHCTFWGWIACIGKMIQTGFTSTGVVRRPHLVRWGMGGIFFYCSWLLSLSLA